MKAHFLVPLLAIMATTAAAEPAPEDLVGTWRGQATWKQCTVVGGARVHVELQRVDGRYQIDLGGLRDDLGVLELEVGIDGSLTGTRNDLEIRMAPRKQRQVVTVTTGAGCVGTATMTRDTTGVPECDRYRALASIQATCSAMGEHRADEADRLARMLTGLPNARGYQRAGFVRQCRLDGDALHAALAAMSCLPAPSAGGLTGIPECNAYVATTERFLRCSAVPASAKEATRQAMAAMAAGWRHMGSAAPELRRAAADACVQAADALRQAAAALGCPMR